MHLAHFRIQDSSVRVLLWLAILGLVSAEVEQDFSDEETTVEDSREVVGKISGVVLLCPDPVLDEVCSLHKRSKIVERLNELLIGLLSYVLVISVSGPLCRLLLINERVLHVALVLVDHLLDRALSWCLAAADFIL